MNIKLELADVSDDEMYALAKFVKHVSYLECIKNSNDVLEADCMFIALSRLQNALSGAGYEAKHEK